MVPMCTFLMCHEPQPALAPRAIARVCSELVFFFFFVSGLFPVLRCRVGLAALIHGPVRRHDRHGVDCSLRIHGDWDWARGPWLKWLRAAARTFSRSGSQRFAFTQSWNCQFQHIGGGCSSRTFAWRRRILENLLTCLLRGPTTVLPVCGSASTLIPWCALMGAAIWCDGAIGQSLPRERHVRFSYLYMANVMGAVAGTIARWR